MASASEHPDPGYAKLRERANKVNARNVALNEERRAQQEQREKEREAADAAKDAAREKAKGEKKK